MDRKELLWASGLFEGEGCITVSSRYGKRANPRLVLASTDLDVVQRFREAVGWRGTLDFRAMRLKNPTHKNVWAWRLDGFENVQAVIAMLWFGLGERRRARAAEVLKLAIA